jgi:hypothetical protein
MHFECVVDGWMRPMRMSCHSRPRGKRERERIRHDQKSVHGTLDQVRMASHLAISPRNKKTKSDDNSMASLHLWNRIGETSPLYPHQPIFFFPKWKNLTIGDGLLFARRNDNRKTWLKKKLTTFFKDFIFLDEGAKSWAHIKYPNPTIPFRVRVNAFLVVIWHAPMSMCVCVLCVPLIRIHTRRSRSFLKILKF